MRSKYLAIGLLCALALESCGPSACERDRYFCKVDYQNEQNLKSLTDKELARAAAVSDDFFRPPYSMFAIEAASRKQRRADILIEYVKAAKAPGDYMLNDTILYAQGNGTNICKLLEVNAAFKGLSSDQKSRLQAACSRSSQD